MITSPRTDASPREASRSSAALPAIALVVGLALLAVVVGRQPSLSPAALHKFFGTSTALEPVDVKFAGVYHDTPFSPFETTVPHRWWGWSLGLAFVYLSAITALGAPVVRMLRGEDRWPAAVSAAAGFLPGYLIVLTPLQLLYAAVPFRTATWIALVATPAAALVVHRRSLRDFVTTGRRVPGARGRVAWTLPAVLGLVAVALVHRLQTDGAFLTQDSIHWYLFSGAYQLLGGARYLAQWAHQSDEWIVAAPLLFSSRHTGDLWLPFYLTQGVGIVSFATLAFGLVHQQARRRKNLAAGLSVAVMFALTPAIVPVLYATVIVGGQPFYEMGHEGRFLGVVAPWAALLLAARRSRWTRPEAIAVGLATLGLAYLSVNVLLHCLCAVGAVVAWRALRGRRAGWIDARAARAALQVVPAVALGLFVAAFWLIQTTDDPGRASQAAWALVVGALLALLGALVVTLGAAADDAGRATVVPLARRSLAWAGLAVLSLFLSNNLIAHSGVARTVRSGLAALLPGYGAPLQERPDLQGSLFHHLSFPTISEPACSMLIECRGVAAFLVCFGVLFLLTLVAWAAMGPLTRDADDAARRALMLILVAFVGVGLAVVFFTGGATENGFAYQAVIFTRFLELPWYGLLVLITLTLVESRNRWTAIVGTSVLVVWTVVPFVVVRRPEELVRNAGWFLRHWGVL